MAWPVREMHVFLCMFPHKDDVLLRQGRSVNTLHAHAKRRIGTSREVRRPRMHRQMLRSKSTCTSDGGRRIQDRGSREVGCACQTLDCSYARPCHHLEIHGVNYQLTLSHVILDPVGSSCRRPLPVLCVLLVPPYLAVHTLNIQGI